MLPSSFWSTSLPTPSPACHYGKTRSWAPVNDPRKAGSKAPVLHAALLPSEAALELREIAQVRIAVSVHVRAAAFAGHIGAGTCHASGQAGEVGPVESPVRVAVAEYFYPVFIRPHVHDGRRAAAGVRGERVGGEIAIGPRGIGEAEVVICGVAVDAAVPQRRGATVLGPGRYRTS